MPSRRNTTAAAAAASNDDIVRIANGANDIKEYIQYMTDAAQRIRDEFKRDIQGVKAVVKKEGSTHGSHDFKADMTVVKHRTFIYEKECLNQSSPFLQAEMPVVECLKQLEDIRKMVVNQKQEKNTMDSMIKKGIGKKMLKQIISGEGQRGVVMTTTTTTTTTAAVAAASNDSDDDMLPAEFHELEYESLTTKALNELIEKNKQNHATLSKNLLKQAEAIMTMLRRHILAFKIAAEDTIGEIIHHAEKCRAFIAHMRHLDVIEYCASAWWHQTQKDAMDSDEYFVTLDAVGEPTDFNAFSLQKPHNAFPDSPMSVLKIRVVGIQTTIGEENHICEYVLDRELAETILTEQSLEALQHIIDDEEQQQRQGSAAAAAMAWA
jgi:hypothetical protein